MIPSSLVSIAVLLLFVVPGFIAIQVKRRLVVLRTQTQFEELLSSIAISAVVLGAIEVTTRALTETSSLFDQTRWLTSKHFWTWYLIVIFVGAAAGFGWGLLLGTSFPEWLLRKFGVRVGVVPGPWDRLFSIDNAWIRVHLKNGWMIDGWKRYASAFPDAHELLIADATIYDSDSNHRGGCAEIFVTAAELSFVEHYSMSPKANEEASLIKPNRGPPDVAG